MIIIEALREASAAFQVMECGEPIAARNILILNVIKYRKIYQNYREDERKTLEEIKSIIQVNLNQQMEKRGDNFDKGKYSSIYILVQLANTPALIGIETGVRMIYASCFSELT